MHVCAQQMVGCDGCNKVPKHVSAMQPYILMGDARCLISNILHGAYCKFCHSVLAVINSSPRSKALSLLQSANCCQRPIKKLAYAHLRCYCASENVHFTSSDWQVTFFLALRTQSAATLASPREPASETETHGLGGARLMSARQSAIHSICSTACYPWPLGHWHTQAFCSPKELSASSFLPIN